MTANNYLEQVLKIQIPLALHGDSALSYTPNLSSDYVEDGAGTHGVKRCLVKPTGDLGIPVHPQPVSLPDMNTIEHVWNLIKQSLRQWDHFPRTKAEMRQTVQEQWERLTPEDRTLS